MHAFSPQVPFKQTVYVSQSASVWHDCPLDELLFELQLMVIKAAAIIRLARSIQLFLLDVRTFLPPSALSQSVLSSRCRESICRIGCLVLGHEPFGPLARVVFYSMTVQRLQSKIWAHFATARTIWAQTRIDKRFQYVAYDIPSPTNTNWD